MLNKMGCDPIILVGQDLAFTYGSNYANQEPGAVISSTGENKGMYVPAEDIYGNAVYTIPAYLAMRNWFEGYFEKLAGKVEIINATEGGLNIEFSRNESLAAVMETYKFKQQDIEERIKEIYREGRFKDTINDDLQSYLRYVLGEVDKLETLSKKQLELVKLVENDGCDPKKNSREYERVLNSINDISGKVVDSPIYASLLRNLIEIDFYLIKAEVDRATKALTDYRDIKAVFTNAIIGQNRILGESLSKIKAFISESEKNILSSGFGRQ
ncbi:MAG: hypothetical protein BWY74_02119 [Firmicutes bacterium ADurb.Bin419]|nr:MAG: hypothetical protein BWY74_02119 [Firmicutes bacterium ADurb.Bin419]